MARVVRTILIGCSLLTVCLRLSAQEALDKLVTLEVASLSAVQVIDELEVVTKQTFSYNPSTLPTSDISGSWQETPLRQVLSETLGEGFSYKERGNYVIIQAPKVPTKQTFAIAGTVVDETTGSQLSNVSVFEANTLTASLSDESGNYNLKVASRYEEATFIISKQNYQDTLIRVRKGEPVPSEIQLRPAPVRAEADVQMDRTKFFKGVIATKIQRHLANVKLGEQRPIQLSLLPAVGTNGLLSGKITNNVSLNIIAGLAYGVKGVELGGAINIIRQNVSGFQAGGLGNYVGGDIKGAQAAGALNVTLGSTTGAQLAGAINVNIEDITGLQAAGMLNQMSGKFKGLQAAGMGNWAGEVRGMQTAGMINYAWDPVHGVQLAGMVNYARDHVHGLQLSLFNYTYTLSGVQIGLVNIVNDSRKSVSIGLINIVKNGLKKVELSYDDATNFNLSYRMGTKGFYTIYVAGIHNQKVKHWNYGLGFGTQVDFKGNYFSNLEAVSLGLLPLNEDIEDKHKYTLVKVNLNLGYSFHKHFSVVMGPQLNIYIRDRSREDAFQIEPDRLLLEEGGVSMWLGYRVGVRF